MYTTVTDPRVVFVDIDDTLIMYNITEMHFNKVITVEFVNGNVTVIPHLPNIELVKKMYRLGYHVTVWSHSGTAWAELIIKSVGLTNFVNVIMTKPHYYIDDKEASSFMTRIWKDPVDGSEK